MPDEPMRIHPSLIARAPVSTFAAALLAIALAAPAPAQAPNAHYFQSSSMPAGAVGTMQLQRGGPIRGYYQPVEIVAPEGVTVSLAAHGRFLESEPTPITAGMLVGSVYRLRVSNIPLEPGAEVFPTIEVINRLYPPPGQEHKFPILVEIDAEDLRLALDGKLVTRVIYLEDPQRALPVNLAAGGNWFEAAPGDNPLEVADRFGRPVAILRMGGRLPLDPEQPDAAFMFGSPPFLRFVKPTFIDAPPPLTQTANRPAARQEALR